MTRSTQELRGLWKAFECKEAKMEKVPFGPDRIRVAPGTADSWAALAAVMAHHGYAIRTTDTDSYNCREAKGANGRSLHSFGIALDVNWKTNPWRDHGGERAPRFSAKATQDERAEDVRRGLADTDMTKAMIDDVLAVRTRKNVRVFEWGGNWKSVKDAMHFELDLSPDELAEGIDWGSVKGWQEPDEDSLEIPAAAGIEAGALPAAAPAAVAAAPAAVAAERHVVIARGGLKLRAGPGQNFGTVRSYPAGTAVHVLAREGEWAQVDLQGDGLADGFMCHAFLRVDPAAASTPLAAPATGAAMQDDLSRATPERVKAMFPHTPLASIQANLPPVLAGLNRCGLTDKPMILMALATIRAETEGFKPIDEGRSRYNTRTSPFDRYDAGTRVGGRLGNTEPGDGARFKGRGYVQLTGRDNYQRIGAQLGIDLASQPALANDPAIAGLILARFLKNKEAAIRAALGRGDLETARKLVNGGTHGFDRFEDAYSRGRRAL